MSYKDRSSGVTGVIKLRLIKKFLTFCILLNRLKNWYLVGIDLIGAHEETKNANRYILTQTDDFTKHVEAIPLSNKSAEAMTYGLYKTYCRHEAPPHVISDQGDFFNEVLTESWLMLCCNYDTVQHAKFTFVTTVHTTCKFTGSDSFASLSFLKNLTTILHRVERFEISLLLFTEYTLYIIVIPSCFVVQQYIIKIYFYM